MYVAEVPEDVHGMRATFYNLRDVMKDQKRFVFALDHRYADVSSLLFALSLLFRSRY